jgi:hypothetical protein
MDDAAHALAKGVIGAVPVGASAVAEMFALIVAPPLEKRRDEWLKALGKAVNELQEKSIFKMTSALFPSS